VIIKDQDRINKMKSCSEVAFTGTDVHGDFTVVRISVPVSQDILDFLKNSMSLDVPQLARLTKNK
jgi:hypothetical protein